MNISLIISVVLAVFLGSLTRSIFGFGDSVISMPLLALLPISLATSVSLIGLTGLMAGGLVMFSSKKYIDRRILGWLILSTLLGIPFGLYLVSSVPQRFVTLILGGFLIVYGIYSFLKKHFEIEATEAVKKSQILPWPFGFLAGVLGSAYNMNGIPIVVYGTFCEWDINTFQSTVQSHFAISSLFIVLGHAFGGLWSWDVFILFILSIPTIFLAHRLGNLIRKKIPFYQFENLLFLFILFLGVSLFVRSI